MNAGAAPHSKVTGLTWFVLLSGQMKAELLPRGGPGEPTQPGTGKVHLSQLLSSTVRPSAGSLVD